MIDGGVHYARNGSVRLAYRVLGEGDTTLVWNPGWFSNVDLWTDPSLPFVSFVEALARGTRASTWFRPSPRGGRAGVLVPGSTPGLWNRPGNGHRATVT